MSVTPFNNKKESLRVLTILIISSISLFDISSIVVLLLLPDPNISLCIPASVADAAAANSSGIKMLLANGLISFFEQW